MAYEIEENETPAESIRRIIGEKVDMAEEYLRDWEDEPHEAVHEARKKFKEIRAALRLVRKPLGDVYSRENMWYRDAGRKLSDIRDATALIESVDALEEALDETEPGELGDTEALAELIPAMHDAVEERRANLMDEEYDLEARVRDVLDDCVEGRDRIGMLPLDDSVGFDLFAHGLAKSYRRARRRYRNAYHLEGIERGLQKDDADAHHFHEWRKRVKYHRYHCAILQPMWREVVGARRDKCHDLTDLIGDDHDLVVLRRAIEDERGFFEERVGDSKLDRLMAAMTARSNELRRKSYYVGAALFTETDEALVERFRGYWIGSGRSV
jgi:CHAD domain-containing protein